MKTLLTLATVLTLAVTPVFATQIGSTSGSESLSASSVNINSKSRNNTPDAIAPSFSTANGCALGGGVGAAGPGFAVSVGGSKTDKACELRADTQMLMVLAGKQVAIRHLCMNSEELQKTLSAAGLCVIQSAGTPVASVAPVPQGQAYDKCEVVNGRLHYRPIAGANPQVALAQCKASLKG